MSDNEQNSYPCVYVSPENHSHSLMRVNDGHVQWNYTTMRERVIDMYDKLFKAGKFPSSFSREQMDECRNQMSDVATFSAQFDEVRQADSDDHLAEQLIKVVYLFRRTTACNVKFKFWKSLHVDQPPNEIKSILILTKLAELEDFSKPARYFQYTISLLSQALEDGLKDCDGQYQDQYDVCHQLLNNLKSAVVSNNASDRQLERLEVEVLHALLGSKKWHSVTENGFRACWKFTKTMQPTDEALAFYDGLRVFAFGDEAPDVLRGGCIIDNKIQSDVQAAFVDRFLHVSVIHRLSTHVEHRRYSSYFCWDNFGMTDGRLVALSSVDWDDDVSLMLFDRTCPRLHLATVQALTRTAMRNLHSAVLLKRPTTKLHCDWSAYEPLHARRLMNIVLPDGKVDILSWFWPSERRKLELFGDQLRKVTHIKLLVIECREYVDLKVIKSFLECVKSEVVSKLVLVWYSDEEPRVPWLRFNEIQSLSDYFNGISTVIKSPVPPAATVKLATDPFAVVQQSVETSSQSTQIEKLWRVNDLQRVFGKGRGARIALLDSGVDIAHPDFVGLDLHAKSFVTTELWSADDDEFENNNVDQMRFVEKSPYSDPTSHGTHCVGTIGRIAPDATIFVGKIFDARQNGDKWETVPCSVQTLCEAIYYAVDEFGAHVLSLSCGTRGYNADIEAAIQHAVRRGVIILCAAANYGRLLKNNIAYPAAFGNVICVGSHSMHGDASTFSSAGREVDFLAPGEGVLSAVFGGGRQAYSGTSMAVPFVTALTTLLTTYMLQRGVLLNGEITRVLLRSLCSSEHTSKRGYGVLDVDFLLSHGESFIVNTLLDRGVRVPFGTARLASVVPVQFNGAPTDAFGNANMNVWPRSAEWLRQAKTNQSFIGVILCDFSKADGMFSTADGLNKDMCSVGTLILLPTQQDRGERPGDPDLGHSAIFGTGPVAVAADTVNDNAAIDDEGGVDQPAVNHNAVANGSSSGDDASGDAPSICFDSMQFSLGNGMRPFLFRDWNVLAWYERELRKVVRRSRDGHFILRRRSFGDLLDDLLASRAAVHNQAANLIASLINVERLSFLGCSITKMDNDRVHIDTNSGTLHLLRLRNDTIDGNWFDNDGRGLAHMEEGGVWRTQFTNAFASLGLNAEFGEPQVSS